MAEVTGTVGRWIVGASGGALIVVGLVRRRLNRSPDRAGGGKSGPVQVAAAITIDRPPDDLYRVWRDFTNLPRFMTHLVSVSTDGDGRSHWVAHAPLGQTVAWDAEITEDRPGERIAWRSLPEADVANTGEVRFVPAPGDRGTEVHVELGYTPPAGGAGVLVANLFTEEPSQQVKDGLRRFKQIIETGEAATTQGQPSRRSAAS